MRIPKIMHFIWAGGDNALPDSNIDVIKSWSDQNPSFKVCLWVDRQSSTSFEEIQNRHIQMLSLGDKLEIKDIEETQNLNGENIRVADEYVRYEIDRMRPNYGLSSDLLRYKILEEIGGAYLDSDVKPGEKSLEQSNIFDQDFDNHHLYVDPNSQMQGKIGNDALISTSHNPVMKKILETAKSHYHLKIKDLAENDYLYLSNLEVADNNQPSIITYKYDQPEYILRMTPFKTGPFCVRKNVENEEGELKSIEECGSKLVYMESITTPSPNNGNWVGKALPISTFEKSSAIILNTIKWEMDKLGILRIDDHINNLIESSGCDPNRAIQEVLEHVNGFDLKKLASIQITHAFEETITLYNGNDSDNLLAKTYLFPLQKICFEQTNDNKYYEPAIEEIINEKKINNLIKLLEENSDQTNANEVLASLNEIISVSTRISQLAMLYCEQIKNTNISRSSNAHTTIIQDYLSFIFNNLTKQEIALAGVAKVFNELINKGKMDPVALQKVIQLKGNITSLKSDMFLKFDLPSEVTKKPYSRSRGEKLEKLEVKEDKVALEKKEEVPARNYRSM